MGKQRTGDIRLTTDNEQVTKKMLQVCETFVSIQGESTHVGASCFFIRLAGCNLRCSYCDTEYAYADGRPRHVPDLVEEFRRSKVPLVEVTGGEPLIQNSVPALLKALKDYGTVLIETNGSRDISPVPAGVIIIMDIKCPCSGESNSMDWKNIQKLRPYDEVKFVIRNRTDYDWARELVLTEHLAKRCHAVLFSPVFHTLQPAELAGWIIHDRVPARLNLQMHKYIWAQPEISEKNRKEKIAT